VADFNTNPMQAEITEPIEGQLRRYNDAFEAAFQRQDSAGLGQLYTEDAALLPPGAPEQVGKKAIVQFWQGAMQMGVAGAKLTTLEAEAHGDTAIEMGRFTLINASGDPLDEGKYIVIWKRLGSHWALHRDIWNTSRTAG
jgi:ketosteroid isomerase-like protein